MQDLNPLYAKLWTGWTSSRVTLLGDAAHAMSPVLGLGANNAIQDADNLSKALINSSSVDYISSIKNYENDMLKRRSSDVLKSRSAALRQYSPSGYFGIIIRNTIMRTIDIWMNIVYFVKNLIF